MRIDDGLKLDFKDVLIRPKRSALPSRSKVSLAREYVFRHTGKCYEGIPIVAANMDTVGTMAMADELRKHGLTTALHKHYPAAELAVFFTALPEQDCYRVAYSTGISQEDLDKFAVVREAVGDKLDFVCVDVANGYSEAFANAVGKLRAAYPNLVIMAGNVVTGEMTEELILRGADIVKVGIGGGSACVTREKAGVGYPQLSAVMECADAAHGLGGLICSDGGCVNPGDIAKAFGAGADFVMLGGMLAGHDECGGEIMEQAGKPVRRFYGMSSKTAMEKYAGGLADYRASEGRDLVVPARGAVRDTVLDILGGLRSACTYVGAARLKELSKRTTFVLVHRQVNDSLGQ